MKATSRKAAILLFIALCGAFALGPGFAQWRSAAGAQGPQPFVVSITTSVSGGASPLVRGTTNLPDGTRLLVGLKPPYPACLPHCGDRVAAPAGSYRGVVGGYITVKNGEFIAGPPWETEWPKLRSPALLNLGTYILEVQIIAVSGSMNEDWNQSPDVQAILGPNGEYMLGPLVGACCFGYGRPGSPFTQADAQKSMERLRSNSPLMGIGVYYARYVVVP